MSARIPTDVGLLDSDGVNQDPYDEGLLGAPPLEEEAWADDILPDRIDGPAEEPNEDEITARPSEPPHRITSDELPEG